MATSIEKNLIEDGERYIEILFTSADSTAEQVIGVPTRITITRITAILESGAGTTVNPAIGRAASFTAGSFDEVGSDISGAPAVRVGTVIPNEVTIPLELLYIQPRVDSGSNNTIRVELHIVERWVR